MVLNVLLDSDVGAFSVVDTLVSGVVEGFVGDVYLDVEIACSVELLSSVTAEKVSTSEEVTSKSLVLVVIAFVASSVVTF